MESLFSLKPSLQASLRAAAHWFRSMTNPATCRLHYIFEPSQNRHRDQSSPVRDIGTAADLAVLQARTGSQEFNAVISYTLQHYNSMLVHKPVGQEEEQAATGHPEGPSQWCYLSPGKRSGSGGPGLGEPSSIAHSAMFLLALTAWEGYPEQDYRQRLMAELAEGLLHQQRQDGSFKVYFAPSNLPDSGWQLYGGEAAYALAAAYNRGLAGDDRWLQAAYRALLAYERKYRSGEVDSDELVFFANWQCQAGAAVHAAPTATQEQRRHLASYLHGMQQRIIREAGFYDWVQQAPEQQATVEVACALEGLAHCMHISAADAAAVAAAPAATAAAGIREPEAAAVAVEQEQQRQQLYAECARVAVDFLLEAQVAAGPEVPTDAVGGFGHSVRQGSGQRVDVTGHVVCAFIKLLELLQQQQQET